MRWNPLQRERIRTIDASGAVREWFNTFRNNQEQNAFLEQLAAADSPRLTALVRTIVGGLRGIDGVEAIRRWVMDHIAYGADTSEDILQSPLYTIRRGAGDCKDQSTLVCALVRAYDPTRPCRIVSMGQTIDLPMHVLPIVAVTSLPSRPPRFVSDTNAQAPAGWAWLETTVPGLGWNESPGAVHARMLAASEAACPAGDCG
jgi:transglutaminase-like putative cysteine protease